MLIVGGLINGGTGLDGGEVVFLPGCSSTDCSESDFSHVSAAATKADVAFVVLGLQQVCNHSAPHAHHCRGYMKDQNSFEQEGHDRTSIALPPHQYALAAAVAKARANTTSFMLGLDCNTSRILGHWV